jgi:hypothetical protein
LSRQTFVFWEEILIEQEKATPIKYRGKQRLVPRFCIQSTTAFADHSYSALAPAALILSPYPCHGFCIPVFSERQTLVFQTANDTARARYWLSSLETLAVSVQGGN